MPGGKVHAGEHLDAAVEREVREEAGIAARFGELCGAVTERVVRGSRLEAHYLLLVCRLATRSVRLAGSGEGEVRWFAEASVGRMTDLIPSDRLMLERLVLVRPRQRFYRCVVAAAGADYRVRMFR